MNHSKFKMGMVFGILLALGMVGLFGKLEGLDEEAFRQCYAEVTRAR